MLKQNDAMVVMIDFQDKLINATKAEKEAENALKIIKTANILGLPVVISEQYPKGLGNTNSTIAENFVETTKIIEKTSFSFLKQDNVLEILKSYNKKQIILFGIETHICVLQTALDLIENGFEVYLIKNACKSRQEYEYNSGLDVMRDNGVNVITLEIALFELLETSKHPNFKEIQSLIK